MRPKDKTQAATSSKSKDKGHSNNRNDASRHTPSQGPSGQKGSKTKLQPSMDSEGFWTPEKTKRARATSPKSNDELTTKNTYLVLEDSSPVKKKVIKEFTRARSTGSLNRENSQSPTRHMKVENSHILETREKSRIPLLDRPLSRDHSSALSSQSKDKAGKSQIPN